MQALTADDQANERAVDVVDGLGLTEAPPRFELARPGPLGLLTAMVSVGADLVGRLTDAAGSARLTGRERTALVRIAAAGPDRSIWAGRWA